MLGALKIGLIAFLAGSLVASGGVWWLRDQMNAKAALARSEAAVRAERANTASVVRSGTITATVGLNAARETERIRTVTRTIVERVPYAITPETDRSYPLPLGLVRVLDAASSGVPVEAVSRSPGQPDDAPSTVTASSAGTVIAGNYGACREDQARLAAWQEWYREQREGWGR